MVVSHATGPVSRIIGAKYVGFGLKSPIHAANRGRVATHASLRSGTSRSGLLFNAGQAGSRSVGVVVRGVVYGSLRIVGFDSGRYVDACRG
ncbi:MAG: hypothetical protein JWQ55_2202 [Rhodopila sp.]|jgi:hypothetical protein|nr:hypothetical protein [Rhodopila sp.]